MKKARKQEIKYVGGPKDGQTYRGRPKKRGERITVNIFDNNTQAVYVFDGDEFLYQGEPDDDD
jgi:hypothetical protein